MRKGTTSAEEFSSMKKDAQRSRKERWSAKRSASRPSGAQALRSPEESFEEVCALISFRTAARAESPASHFHGITDIVILYYVFCTETHKAPTTKAPLVQICERCQGTAKLRRRGQTLHHSKRRIDGGVDAKTRGGFVQ